MFTVYVYRKYFEGGKDLIKPYIPYVIAQPFSQSPNCAC